MLFKLIGGAVAVALLASSATASAAERTSPASQEPALYVQTAQAFDEICAQPQYLVSPSFRYVAAFSTGLLAADDPFAGNPYKVGVAEIGCLFETSGDQCSRGWTIIESTSPLVGASFEADDLRLAFNGAAYRFSSRDRTLAPEPSAPRSRVLPMFASENLSDGRWAPCSFSICRRWPRPGDLALYSREHSSRPALVVAGEAYVAERERQVRCGDRLDCLSEQFAPRYDLTTGYVTDVVPAISHGDLPSKERFLPALSFSFGSSQNLSISGFAVPLASEQRIVLVRHGATMVQRACPARIPSSLRQAAPDPVPQDIRVDRRVLGDHLSEAVVLYRHAHDEGRSTGTFVFFRGGPLGRTRPGMDNEALLAFERGAVVVTVEATGARTTATGAWSRLRRHGLRAIARDAEMLEAELSDTSRYPRPLILAGASFGALSVRMLLERERLWPDGVLLVAPMTRYVSPREMRPAGENDERAQSNWAENELFHQRIFGSSITSETSRLRHWIDQFDPCSLPEQSLVIVSPIDRRAPWPEQDCFRGTLVSVPTEHGLIHLSERARSAVQEHLDRTLPTAE